MNIDQFIGSNFVWFTGVVEDIADPLKLNRVRVRCFGFHTEEKVNIPTSALPWATVMMPTTASGMSGIGMSPHWLLQGSWVIGFFRDGESAQDPIVLGSIAGLTETAPDSSKGFSDPLGVYPRELNESDVNKMARGEATFKYIPSAAIGEPASSYKAIYTKNHVVESEAGHKVEIDDTPSGERIRIIHRSGSFVEMHPDGSVSARQQNKYDVTIGNDNLRVNGDVNLVADGSVNWIVGKDLKFIVAGNIDFLNGGNHSVSSGGTYTEKAKRINMNPDSEEFSFENQKLVLALAGSNAVDDDNPVPQPIGEDIDYSTGEAPITDNTVVEDKPETILDVQNCNEINEGNFSYNYNISPNFTIASVSINTLYPHKVKAQQGFTIGEIICNMEGLAVNILEPLAAKYPDLRINHGFRTAKNGSQHERGMAVDIQFPGISNQEYYDRALWVKENLPFDQFIFEHGNSIWFHLSYDRTKQNQRNQSLTYYKKQYLTGTRLYYA